MGEARPLVVDANVIIAASLKEGVARRLLLDARLVLYAPHHLWTELMPYRKTIAQRAGLAESLVDVLWTQLKERIITVPEALVRQHLAEARERLAGGDQDDAPYLAAALAVRGSIWTHDIAFRRRARIPTTTTHDLLRLLDDAA